MLEARLFLVVLDSDQKVGVEGEYDSPPRDELVAGGEGDLKGLLSPDMNVVLEATSSWSMIDGAWVSGAISSSA